MVKMRRLRADNNQSKMERELVAFLNKKPGSDEFDICEHLRISLPTACDLIDRMVAEKKIQAIDS